MRLLIICFAINCVTCSISLAYSENVTHPILSNMAIFNSDVVEILSDISFCENLTEVYNGRPLLEWFQKGAADEDLAFLKIFGRFYNHFHNPISMYPWEGAGLYSGALAAPDWAQNASVQKASLGGDRTWSKARTDYWSALMSSESSDRDRATADVFYDLGHQVHLLQDMAVPAHVRLDAHPLDSIGALNEVESLFYEKYLAVKYADRADFEVLVGNVVKPNFDFRLYGGGEEAPSPVSMLFDADIYQGLAAVSGGAVGLAEYTNSNFFSNDTIFSVENPDGTSGFPFPRWESTNIQSLIDGEMLPVTAFGEDGLPEEKIYIKKVSDGEPIEHFLRAGYLESEYSQEEKEVYLDDYKLNFFLDEACHEEYAHRLLPRAVGYSSAMLDYFFRARGNVAGVEILDEEGDVVGMDVRLTNVTEGEALVDPILAVSGRYHFNSDDWEFSASTQGAINGALRNEEDVAVRELSFETIVDLTTDNDASFNEGGSSVVLGKAIPVSATEKEYLLAFKGELGGEPEAVGAAKLELGWSEDWNQGVASNHPWYIGPDSTDVEAEFWSVEDSKLQMRNVRPAGETSEYFNEIVLDAESIENAEGVKGIELPFEIQPDTILVIDVEPYVMTSGLPLEDCNSSVSRQEVLVEFDTVTPLHVLLPGSTMAAGFYAKWSEGRIWAELGKVMQDFGFLSDEKHVHITGMSVRQSLGELCEPAEEDHVQELAIDYIRVF